MKPYHAVFSPADPAVQALSTQLGAVASVDLGSGAPSELTPWRLRELVLPAIHQRRLRVHRDVASRPVAFMVWAMLADDVDASLRAPYGNRLHPSQWNEGTHFWILLARALPGHAMSAFLSMRRAVLRDAGPVSYFSRPRHGRDTPSQAAAAGCARAGAGVDLAHLGHVLTVQGESAHHQDLPLRDAVGALLGSHPHRRVTVYFGAEGHPAAYVVWQWRPGASPGRGGVVRVLDIAAPFGHLRHLLPLFLQAERRDGATVLYRRRGRRHVLHPRQRAAETARGTHDA
ncbi:toxin-activating lysine-acyltransferase [Mitsuaria sp. GD03876]|uniref:toxin-activating lysine-acyltransferase n=1 Tax=Mitsuaria sp. GD03876 TaxID=2975399 RepID=UPI0024480581|nr:toxin-activating lysine-acyltransferase [Mitsuaria sp. GD03876]MDH0863932.1 toxin-activating lysine-acyltransferase [Mitsuaria sp. GD03876]